MLNKTVLMGRLTHAPELKTTQNGVSVLSFSLAVDRRFRGQNNEKVTDFINCVAWRGTAEFISKFFAKGDLIAITGEIQTRDYTDRDGNKRTAFEVIADEAHFCGGKNNNGAGANTETADFTELTDFDGDLPFN